MTSELLNSKSLIDGFLIVNTILVKNTIFYYKKKYLPLKMMFVSTLVVETYSIFKQKVRQPNTVNCHLIQGILLPSFLLIYSCLMLTIRVKICSILYKQNFF